MTSIVYFMEIRRERNWIDCILSWLLPFTNITLIELCLWSCYLNCNCDMHITLQGVATWLVTVTILCITGSCDVTCNCDPYCALQGVVTWLVTVTHIVHYRELRRTLGSVSSESTVATSTTTAVWQNSSKLHHSKVWRSCKLNLLTLIWNDKLQCNFIQ